MFQEASVLIIFIYFAVFFAFTAGIFLFVVQARKNRDLFKQEKNELKQQHIHEILTTQVDTQLKTMQHIGSEIHDNVGQKLTLASLYTKQLKHETQSEYIDRISKLIDESLHDLRQLSKTLTDPNASNKNIITLLREDAIRINDTGRLMLDIKSNIVEPKLSPEQKNTLYRLLQEFVQNSLKHSGGKKILITFEQLNNDLTVTAKDDGKGFDTSSSSKGIGLQNMRNRAEKLNATFDFSSGKNIGTILTLQFKNQ